MCITLLKSCIILVFYLLYFIYLLFIDWIRHLLAKNFVVLVKLSIRYYVLELNRRKCRLIFSLVSRLSLLKIGNKYSSLASFGLSTIPRFPTQYSSLREGRAIISMFIFTQFISGGDKKY